MFDTVAFSLDAPMGAEFMRKAWPVMAPATMGQRAKAANIMGNWVINGRWSPHQRYGYSAVWRATHVKLGVTVAYVGDRLISFSGSLPRILHGSNREEIRDQRELDQAMQILIQTVGLIADIEGHVTHAKLKRADLVAYVGLPLRTIKESLRYARHPCSRKEPEIRSNSIHFNGTDISVFCYDKELKEKIGQAGTRTRVEIRLKNRKTVEKCHALFGKGPRLNIYTAYSVYRNLIGLFPNQGAVTEFPQQNIHQFVAHIECVMPASILPRPIEIYVQMKYSNPAARDTFRRAVAKALPIVLNVRLTERLTTPYPRTQSSIEPLDMG